LSKAFDNCTYDHTNGAATCLYQITQDPQEMWGLSVGDVTHRVTGSVIYKVPDNVGKSLASGRSLGVLNAVAGGWQASAVLNVEGGVPFTVTTSGTNLSNSNPAGGTTWLPNRIGSGALPNPSISKWFDPTAFVAASPYTFGNSGRDILRGPGYGDVDFGLAKRFRLGFLGEQAFLQIRADSSDVLNHPNFGMPASAIGAGNVGTITSALTNRTLQFGARIVF
jgi:hypothetical protein